MSSPPPEGAGRGGAPPPTSSAQSSSQTRTTSQNRTNRSARIVAQTNIDAKLDADFEEFGEESFDYSRSVHVQQQHGSADHDHDQQQLPHKVMAYLQHIQRGRFIQPFGCLLALDNKSLRVLAFSANAPDMLTSLPVAAVPDAGTDVPSIERPVLSFGCDIRCFFTAPSTAALQKAALSSPTTDLSLLNPILVHTRSSGRPFYAILHRVTRCLIVDLEPVKPAEPPMSAAGALQSYKLAAKAIARIQSLPGGSLQNLCNAVVEEVFELTGYDRVMTYRFHDDDHGEVFAEVTKPGLDPYLGLHYPATDIPQAARFLFMKNKVRMICDCRAKPVTILQDDALGFDITFCGSTLRAPHSCHLQYMQNMNSIASLVMAVVVNALPESERGDADDNQQQSQPKKRLWGLIVCHNESPRFVPFPLRYACEFLAQVFAIHVNKEFELENQIREKNILRTQTLLCDMLLKQAAPQSIITGSPNIMDLVICDGAALLYQTKVWRLGLTPTESQIRHIALWLRENHIDSTGLSTDSLHEAGYPEASALGDTVCGMAAAQINSKDILFWFRSHTAAEIRWGGAKHDPSQQDDGRKMHPRSSFKAFLEVVKMRSQPWKDYEMDAVHSLQLILRGSLNNENSLGREAGAVAGTAALESKIDELRLQSMAELESVTNEMVRLIETATVPILAVDSSGLINGWNQKIAELTGLAVGDAIGKNFLSLVEEDSLATVKKMLFLALQGKEEKNVQFQLKTHRARREDGPVILIVNVCCSRDINEEVVGACFVAHDMTGQKMVMDRFIRIEGDYKSIIQNPNPLIPPIFGADEFGWCTEWNTAMAHLSGWSREDVIDKMLLGEVFGGQLASCRMKNQDAFVSLSIIINTAMTGQDMEKAPFGFYTRNGKFVECLLSVSKKVNGEGRVTGVFCFLQVTSQELQHMIEVQQLMEQTTAKKLKALAYIRQETRNPLAGMVYCQRMMDSAGLNQEQRTLIDIGSRCQRQLSRVLDDLDLDSIMDSCLELEMVEFELRNVILTAVSQVALTSQEKGVRLVYNLDQDFMSEGIYGDRLRLQQIIADFLAVSVKFSPSGGLVELASALVKQPVGQTLHLINIEITIKHSHPPTGSKIAEELVSQMFGSCDEASDEGLGLLVCRKLLRLMNGDVRYLQDASKSAFILSLELASAAPAPDPAKIYKPQPMRTFL